MRRVITFRPYTIQDRPWVQSANSSFYQETHHFDKTFNDAVTSALDLIESRLSEPRDKHLIAECVNQPAGCIFFSAETEAVGRIRLFFLEETYRGKGYGKAILNNILLHAKENDFKTIRVSTFDRHPEACQLYERLDFTVVNQFQTQAFGHVLQQLDYELSLVST